MVGRRGKGEGSIYQRDDGVWVGAIDLGWVGGKRSRKVVNGRTRGDVVKKMMALQPVIAQGISPVSERLTVEAYLEQWLTTRVPGTITVRTEMLYAHVVHAYINPSLGKIRLAKLTPSDVARMLQDLEAKNFSPSTRRMARATLRQALRMAEQDGILARNSAAIAEGVKMDQREGRSFTPEQAKVFLAAVKDHRLEAAYVLTLALGLRRGEVLDLTWGDVEACEDTVVLSIRRQMVDDRDGVHLSDLKTVGSRRRLHLSPPLIELLEQRRVRQQAEELVRGPRWNNANDLIFTTSVGTPLNPDGFGKTVPKLCKEAGLGHWSIHELRHSCASLLMAQEVPLEVVAEQLGHASIRVTKDVYGHLMPSSRAKAAEAMRTVLFEDDVRASTQPSDGLATKLATNDVANSYSGPLTRDLVGRPGLDPGTLRVSSDYRGGPATRVVVVVADAPLVVV